MTSQSRVQLKWLPQAEKDDHKSLKNTGLLHMSFVMHFRKSKQTKYLFPFSSCLLSHGTSQVNPNRDADSALNWIQIAGVKDKDNDEDKNKNEDIVDAAASAQAKIRPGLFLVLVLVLVPTSFVLRLGFWLVSAIDHFPRSVWWLWSLFSLY